MLKRRHLVFWLMSFLLFSLTLWVLKEMLLPFILGAAIAYFLDPVVDKLEEMKLPRAMAVFVVLVFLTEFCCVIYHP